MKRTLFIVNKKSGLSDKKRITQQIDRWIDTTLYDYNVVFTEYKGHATILSKKAVEQEIDLVVAVGGDGSVNEIAQGLINTDTTLAIIPKGSGNGLARTMKIPLSPSKALQVINNAYTQEMDVGYINDHLFLSNAGIGFDAMVTKVFEKNKTRGLLGYLQSLPPALLKHHPLDYELQINHQTIFGKAFMINIANGNQMGFNFQLSPQASLFDGLLNVAIIEKLKPWKVPPIVIKSFTKKESRYINYYRGESLKIVSKEDIHHLQVDGELIPCPKRELVIKIKPKALKILTPRLNG